MNAATFRQLRLDAGLSVRGAARALGCSPRSISYWEAGEHRIPSEIAEALTRLQRSLAATIRAQAK